MPTLLLDGPPFPPRRSNPPSPHPGCRRGRQSGVPRDPRVPARDRRAHRGRRRRERRRRREPRAFDRAGRRPDGRPDAGDERHRGDAAAEIGLPRGGDRRPHGRRGPGCRARDAGRGRLLLRLEGFRQRGDLPRDPSGSRRRRGDLVGGDASGDRRADRGSGAGAPPVTPARAGTGGTARTRRPAPRAREPARPRAPNSRHRDPRAWRRPFPRGRAPWINGRRCSARWSCARKDSLGSCPASRAWSRRASPSTPT